MPQPQTSPIENHSTPLRIGVMAFALLLGFIGALLLPITPWGINVLLFIIVLLAAVFFLTFRNQLALTGGGRWLVIPILVFAALFSFRDSTTLALANLLALLLCLGLAATRTLARQLRVAGILDYVFDWVQSGFLAAIGILALVFGTKWSEVSLGKQGGTTASIVRGLLIALPLLLIFGGLFAAADAVFQGLVSQVFRFNVGAIFRTFIWTLIWGWLVAGFLYGLLLYHPPTLPKNLRPSWFALGPIEIGIVLGLLNVLFSAFVIVQIRYFFGGADLVQSTTGLSYAEYARRGFFELVTVAALVLPVLLGTHWLFRPKGPGGQLFFTILALLLIAMLFVIMVSAVERMRLYIDVFGLTELRLYTTAFMGWLALMFLWFIATVLRGARDRFAFGALMLGLGVLIILNVMNPDEWIVSTNLSRPDAAQPLDASYLSTLSMDAYPALIRVLPALSPNDRCEIASEMTDFHTPPAEFGTFISPKGSQAPPAETFDWRTANLGRLTAWRAIAANWQMIASACSKR